MITMSTVYVDMDGVLAKWRSVDVSETFKPGYFLSLEVDQKIYRMLQLLTEAGIKTAILSSAYPHTSAREEKQAWLSQIGLSDMKQIFVPYGENKAEYIQDNSLEAGPSVKLLIDDYSNNLRKWVSDRETLVPVKYYNGVNGSKGTWKGHRIRHEMEPHVMAAEIKDIIRQSSL